jgi:DNA modification methylase
VSVRILTGDCRDMLRTLPDESVHCCVTSPPYWGLRDYGVDGQIGLERSPDAYVAEIVAVARELRRVLRSDGTFWLNIGDSYVSNGRYPSDKSEFVGDLSKYSHRDPRVGARDGNLKPKDLVGIPWRVAFALQADGWWLRQDIIWSKPNPMPESVTDRCTKAHEYIFLLSKSAKYHFDAAAIAEPVAREFWNESVGPEYMRPADARNDGGKRKGAGPMNGTRNKRDVWEIATASYSEAHFATFPPALIEPCILAGCPEGGTVLDPFFGAGTTGLVCDRLNRNCIGIELNPAYAAMARKRIEGESPLFAEVAA